jgi:hypothetical protein
MFDHHSMRSSSPRRGVRRHSGLRRVLEIVFGFSIAVGGGWLLRESPTHWKVMHDGWDHVEGVITASGISNPGRPDLFNRLRLKDRQKVELDYRYRVGNQELKGFGVPAPKQPSIIRRNNRTEAEHIAASYNVGAPITVYFDPSAPRQSRLTEHGSGTLFGMAFGFGSLMILAGAALIWVNCR